jgi:hypothetical protein
MKAFRVVALLIRVASAGAFAALFATGEAVGATVTLLLVADTCVNQGQLTINYSGSPNLEVARFGEFLTVWRSYLRLDLTTIPNNAIVESGEPRLYLNSAVGNLVSVSVSGSGAASAFPAHPTVP